MRVRVLLIAALLLGLGAGATEAADFSGTVAAVNRDTGTIVIAEIGPWQVKGGQTLVTERTIAVAPSTRFVAVRRSRDTGPSGFTGEFVDVPLDPWAVKQGDFVTVRAVKAGDRLTALTVTVAAE